MSVFISSGCCVMLAWMFLVLPVRWILPAMLAVFFHEACHYLAILLCTGKTASVGFYSFAARMPLPQMGRGQELFCALAGPLGGLLLGLLLPVFPRLALCGLIQSLYNLLPVYPLDGGRALRSLLKILLPPIYADWVCIFLQWLCIGSLLILGIYAAAVWKLGLFPLAATGMLIIKSLNRKIPCNADVLALQ